METEIDKYFVTEKKLDDLINQGDTYIVFDTNVLLAAYQWRNATKEQIEKIINKFYNENKLKYSMQVIKEFSKNRVFLIRERINDVANEMDMLTNVTPLEKLIPILNGKEIYMKTQEIQKDYIRYINLYRDQLKIIKDELKKLVSDDSFFNLIYNTAQGNIIKNYTNDELEELKIEGRRRFENKIPPVFKDKNKTNGNEYGDYILWKELMSLKSNVIFVSNDEKADWCLKSDDGEILTTNLELLKEFFEETGGKNFIHIPIIKLAQLLNQNINQDVLADLSESALEDTIIVPAREMGFNTVFLGQNQWYDIRISQSRMRNLKYIAVYQVAPVSAITYYAKIKEIVDSDNVHGYKKIIIEGEPIKLEKPIRLGDNTFLAPQGSRYTFISRLLNAFTLEDLFD